MASIVGTKGNNILAVATGGDTVHGDPFHIDPLIKGRGGNDILTGINANNAHFGDAQLIAGTGRGGNDRLSVFGDSNDLYGDALAIAERGRGGNDQLDATGDSNDLFGDTASMTDDARGGNDSLSASGSSNFLVGDGQRMTEQTRGGNDALKATGEGNRLMGDARDDMFDDARGGNDSLIVVGDNNLLAGDSGSTMNGASRGGNDHLRAEGDGNNLYGDSRQLNDESRGGNDTLVVIGEAGEENSLYGDAIRINTGEAYGGNDLLIGGLSDDLLVGDVRAISPGATFHGGNDRLWGDPTDADAGGADRFAFAGLNGRDVIYDFRPEEGDLLDLLAYGFGDGGLNGGGTYDFADLDYSVAGGSTLIDIGTSFGLSAPGQNTVRLAGFDELQASDFVATV